ncbi:hypothetical protein K439DRAFT_825312 [Ramaria rubella]|nr:hypothetical protein K439DRAFT_825312 [Ramaria rubella]
MADDTTVDFSDGMNSIPSKFSFQGLAETQTQSQGGRIPQETSMEDSQKENKHLLPAPSGSQSLLPPDAMITGPTPPSAELSRPENAGKIIGRAGGAVGKPSSSSHVTQHVTGAWTRVNPSVVRAKNGPASAPSDSAPLMDQKGRGLHATPLKLRNKTVSFLSPTARPPPPALSRISTMPPARNRYAPRDIDHSSQDSFAGPPIRQDLTAFVRSERVFNSTFIRSGRDGEPGEVFEHPSHVSSTSLSEPPDEDEIMSFSQPEQPDDEPSTSQPFRAAFDPGPSPPRAPDPVVLVKDSQSQHSDDDEDGRSGNKSGNKSNKERDKDGEGQDHPSTALPSPSHSSSSSSFHLPSEDVMVATQPNTQSTDSDMQPTQTDPQPDISIPQSVDTSLSRPSPLPVPPHRMRQIAMLQAARLGGRDEIIPETPASTTVPSVRASVAPSRNSTSIVGAPYMEALHEENLEISPPRIEVGRIDKGKGKQMVDPEAGGTLSKR